MIPNKTVYNGYLGLSKDCNVLRAARSIIQNLIVASGGIREIDVEYFMSILGRLRLRYR